MTIQDARDTYKAAKSRLFLLDYDGTLAEFAPTPEAAVPSQELLTILDKITSQPGTTVVVVSGRDKETLTDWLSHLPLAFAAEHGYWRKLPGQQWQVTIDNDAAWKVPIRAIMEEVAAASPGTLVEEKASGLVWHYRTASDKTAATTAAKRLITAVEALAAPLQLRILNGNTNVEVQIRGIDKGTAAQYWLQQHYDFILAAGDDATDEDLFKAMPPTAFTVKVGPGHTSARLRLDSPAAMRQFLDSLTRG